MKKLNLLLVAFVQLAVAAVAQNNSSGEKVEKRIVVEISEDDETDKSEHVIKVVEIGDTAEWTTPDGEKMMKVIIYNNGESEEIVSGEMPKVLRMKVPYFHNKLFLGVHVADNQSDEGVVIESVTSDSPAEKAGLQKGDIITAIAGKTVTNTEELVAAISAQTAGSEVDIDYIRNGKTAKTTTILAEKEETFELMMPDLNKEIVIDIDAIEDAFVADENVAFLGIEPAEYVAEVEGVMILKTIKGSAAAAAGLQTGDVITEFDGKKIKTFEELVAAIKDHKPGDAVSIAYKRMGKNKSANVVLTKRKALITKTIEVEQEWDDADDAPENED